MCFSERSFFTMMATYNGSRGDRATENLWSNCGAPNGKTPPTKGKNMRPHVGSWLVGSHQDCFIKFNVTDLVFFLAHTTLRQVKTLHLTKSVLLSMLSLLG